MFDEPRSTSIAPFVTSTSSMQKMKLLLRIKIYLVPNLEDLTIMVLVTNVSHLYETDSRGLNRRKDYCSLCSLQRGKWAVGS